MAGSRWFFKADAPRSVILIRFMVGGVFLSEGIQKFLFPASGRGQIHNHRNSRAGHHGAVCWNGRDCLRRSGDHWPGDATGLDSAHRDDQRGDCDDENPDMGEQGRVGDGARGADGLLHAAGRHISSDRRRGTVVD